MVTFETPIRVATRGSKLALWQSESVRAALRRAHPEATVQLEVVRTTGDKILDVPLARIGDRGLFTKEIDEALLDRRADVAVHSLKDIPTTLPPGLILAAVGEREDARDVLLAPKGRPISVEELPQGARVGTSSLRRRAQLCRLHPDSDVVDLRGNLETRFAKLDAGAYDAIVLAAAGVLRLGWSARIGAYLDFDQWLPAVGQGALGLVCREDDAVTRTTLAELNHPTTAAAVTAERAFLRALEGGCQVPIGAYAIVKGDKLVLDGFVSSLDGRNFLRESLSANGDPEEIGRQLAARLVARGAEDILRSVREQSSAPPVPAP